MLSLSSAGFSCGKGLFFNTFLCYAFKIHHSHTVIVNITGFNYCTLKITCSIYVPLQGLFQYERGYGKPFSGGLFDALWKPSQNKPIFSSQTLAEFLHDDISHVCVWWFLTKCRKIDPALRPLAGLLALLFLLFLSRIFRLFRLEPGTEAPAASLLDVSSMSIRL